MLLAVKVEHVAEVIWMVIFGLSMRLAETLESNILKFGGVEPVETWT